MQQHRTVILIVAALILASPAGAQWIEFQEDTLARIAAAPALVTADPEEKDYAWGDLDQDGDVDLVIARKQPFTSSGKEPNVLLINDNGVLTDRTLDFASASDVGGDQGFLTPTNDRDIVIVDVDNDGWLDVVTAPTISIGDPKHIGHPRVYRNLGCAGGCGGTHDWLGLRFEDARIPAMLSDSGQSGFNPCFCHVAAGDVTGDGFADLWFADYDTGCGQAGADFNDKLLINMGSANPGFFTDATETRFSGLIGGDPFPLSAFGASGFIADLNDDGRNDIVKQYASFVGEAFNDEFTEGFFDTYDVPYTGAAYFVSDGDLNNDGLIDMVVSDDGIDRYLLNQGNGTDEVADFLSFVFSFNHTGVGGAPADDGFGGNSITRDLDKDGWNDVIITDVDVDLPGCDRRMHIYRNLGGMDGDITLQEQTTGFNCQNLFGNPPECLVATIPADRLEGVHDVAVFDLNGDTYLDMVVGRCQGTEVYLNVPPFGAAGSVDGDSGSTQLILDKAAGIDLSLDWGESCSLADNDYEIYEGKLGNNTFTGHSPVVCSTLGATAAQVSPTAGSTYYLVVPRNGGFEGSYGTSSDGTPRQQGTSACLAMVTEPCE